MLISVDILKTITDTGEEKSEKQHISYTLIFIYTVGIINL